jgi:hypothetical protein
VVRVRVRGVRVRACAVVIRITRQQAVPKLSFPAPPMPPLSPPPSPVQKPNDAGVTKRPAPAAAAKRNASPRPGREENSMRTALRTAMDKRRTSFEDLNSATEPSQDSTSSSIWRP